MKNNTHKNTAFRCLLLGLLLSALPMLYACAEDGGGDDGTVFVTTAGVTVETAADENVIRIPITPSAETFGIQEAAFEAGSWEMCTASFTLPDGWTAIPGDALMPDGRIHDENNTERASYGIMWFDTLDDDPPENIPPEGQEWQAIYASMRLSSFQSMYDYEAVSRGDRYENAVAMLEYIETFVPGEKANAETVIVPIGLGYDRDTSLYLQITWYDDTVDEAVRREIAESITFAEQ